MQFPEAFIASPPSRVITLVTCLVNVILPGFVVQDYLIVVLTKRHVHLIGTERCFHRSYVAPSTVVHCLNFVLIYCFNNKVLYSMDSSCTHPQLHYTGVYW